jgi:hypothetical protein
MPNRSGLDITTFSQEELLLKMHFVSSAWLTHTMTLRIGAPMSFDIFQLSSPYLMSSKNNTVW